MSSLTDEVREALERDERINLRDRGKGRDLGAQPTYDGTRIGTRSEQREWPDEATYPLTFDDNESLSGTFGRRESKAASQQATPIPLTSAGGTLAEGAGAFRGWSIYETGSGVARVVFTSQHNNGVVGVVTLAKDGSATFLDGYGIGYNGLNATVTGTVSGCVYVSTAE